MKKYTKRILAFLLATVMVLSGLPMNAIESKAADGFAIDFNTHGLASTTQFVAGETKGEGWIFMSGLKPKVNSGYIQSSGAGNVIFNFTAPEEGLYNLTVAFGHTGGTCDAEVYVNDIYAGTLKTNDGDPERNGVLSAVSLKGGEYANTIKFVTSKSAYSSKNIYLRLISLNFTPADVEFGEAVFNLEDNANFKLNDTFELKATASMTDGTPATVDVAYASSNDEVAKIENGVLTAVGNGKAVITATVTYEGEVKATFERNISVGTLVVNIQEHNSTTGYIAMDTVSKADTTGVAWNVNSDSKFGSSSIRVFGNYIQVKSDDIIFDFQAPSAGLYNLTADVWHRSNQGQAAIFVNGTYVGNYDAYSTTEESVEKQLLSVNLNEGTNTIQVVCAPDSENTNIRAFKFIPATVEEVKAITGVSSSINGMKEIVVDLANIEEAPAKIDTTVSTTDGAVLVLFEEGKIDRNLVDHVSSNELLVYVNRWGELQYKRVGEVTVTANVGELTDTVTIKVVNSALATVTYVDEDGTPFETFENVEIGAATPTIEKPTKAADEQYTYEFAGWTPEVAETVAGDVTYTATWTKTVNQYTVTWVNEDGTVLETDENVAYGTTPSYDGATPTKAADAQNTYVFANWTPEVAEVTGDVTYTATYTGTVNEYTVTWENEDGTVLATDTVAYGEVPKYTGETPIKAADAQYTYVFDAWTPEVVAVTGDVTYTATYTATVNNYTVTWKNEDGTVLATDTVAYGEVPAYTGETPEKAGDAQYTYTFDAWTPEVVAVTGDATYTATYTETVNEYEITWVVDGDETVETYAYGEVPAIADPSKEADEVNTYKFTGWTPAVVPVTGPATYTAVFEATAIEYVASINDAKFVTLAEAVEEAEADDTITLIDNVTLTEKLTIAKDITLNLGGKTLTLAVGDINNYDVIVKGNLTIEGEGAVFVASTYGIGVTGSLTVEGGSFADADTTYYVIGNWGTTTINDGNFDVAYVAVNGFGGNVTINGGTFKSADADYVIAAMPGCMEVTGGTFDRDVTEYCAEGKVAKDNGDGTYGIIGATYTVTFVVNGEEVSEETYAHGATVVVPEVADYEDTYYTYKFAGWDAEVTEAVATVTYTAKFDKVAKAYTEAVSTNGNSYGELSVDGNVVTLNVTGEVPYVKNPSQYGGVWANWIGFKLTTPEGVDAANVTVTRPDGSTTTLADILDPEATYANIYNGAIPTTTTLVREYKINWNSDAEDDLTVVIDLRNATLLTKTFDITWVVNGKAETVAVEAGKMPVAPTVESYKDAEFTYTFADWDAEIVPAEADATYTAVFDKTVNTYVVTWVNHDGTKVEKAVEYGTLLADVEAPEVSYKSYEFNYWDGEVETVTEDITLTAIYKINGIDEGYYYVDGKVKGNAGVIEIDGNLYFVCYSGKIAAGQNMTVPENKTNGYVKAGTYYFFEDGTMENPADDLLGYVEADEDGVLWYKVKGEVRTNVGLVEINGFWYYVQYSGRVKVNGNQTIADDKLNEYEGKAGTYYFFEDGTMENPFDDFSGKVVDVDGVLWYYVNGRVRKNVGLVELENGDFIFVQYSGKVRVSGNQTITTKTCNEFTEYIGLQKFADGKMIIK